jgi:hypothetical protein
LLGIVKIPKINANKQFETESNYDDSLMTMAQYMDNDSPVCCVGSSAGKPRAEGPAVIHSTPQHSQELW